MTDPTRWLDEPTELSPSIRRLLQAGANLSPPADAEDRGWAEFVALTTAAGAGALAAAASSPSAGGSGGAVLSSKLLTAALLKCFGLGAVLGIGVSAASHTLWNESSGAPPSVQVSVARARPANALSPAGVEPQMGKEETPPTPATARAASSPARGGRPPPPSVPEEPTAPALGPGDSVSEPVLPAVGDVEAAPVPAQNPSSLRAEALELAQAKSLIVNGAPREALALLERSGQRFSNGALGHEREALAIEALMLSHQRELGQKRASAFLRTYPGSPLADRMRKWLATE